MDLSLAPTKTSSDQEQDRDQELININTEASSSSNTTSRNNNNLTMMMVPPPEKEHMFDKVVTPSDVGKLNRLVIPKQHAERYFPLDSTNIQNGTLLSFQDRNGKMWRFRYSYWNSSQSYVMTKGWSRFVKEKKLDAGDIVSFQRGIGDEAEKSKLYIDWRHRPEMSLVHHTHHFGNFGFNFNFPTTSQYSNRFVPLPEYNSFPAHRSLSIGNHHSNNNQRHEFLGYGYGNIGGRCYYNGSPLDQRNIVGSQPLVIESVPVVPGRLTPVMLPQLPPPPPSPTVGKRLRLFGVNMECGNDYSQQQESWVLPRGEMGASSSSTSALRLNLSSTTHDDDDDDGGGGDDDQYAKKGKSFSLDFNP